MRGLLLIAVVTGCGFQVSGQAIDAGDGPQDGARDGGDDASTDASTDGPSPDAPRAMISFMQVTNAIGAAGAFTLSLSQPIVAGDLCVVGIGVQGGSVTNVTDNRGNSYASVVDDDDVHVFVAANMSASANSTLTITLNTPSGYAAAAAVYRGLATVAPVDDRSSAMGTGSAVASGEVQTTHPHDLLVGFAASNGALIAGPDMTARTNVSFLLLEDREVDTAGSYTALATASVGSMWTMALLALKAAD